MFDTSTLRRHWLFRALVWLLKLGWRIVVRVASWWRILLGICATVIALSGGVAAALAVYRLMLGVQTLPSEAWLKNPGFVWTVSIGCGVLGCLLAAVIVAIPYVAVSTLRRQAAGGSIVRAWARRRSIAWSEFATTWALRQRGAAFMRIVRLGGPVDPAHPTRGRLTRWLMGWARLFVPRPQVGAAEPWRPGDGVAALRLVESDLGDRERLDRRPDPTGTGLQVVTPAQETGWPQG